MEYKEILFQIDNGIAVITLNRPDIRNAITGADMIEELENACQRVNQDLSVKVLVITSTDPVFSSGGNIKEMTAKTGMFQGNPVELMENYRRNIQRIPLAIHRVELPTIAAVNGTAVGAGCDLAMMCDMRIASRKAKFGETFVNLGIIPGDGGAYFLPRFVGMAKACELTFTGDIIDAETAYEIGMINYVVEHSELMSKTRELAARIGSKSSPTLRMAKRLLNFGQTATLSQVLEYSATCQAICHHTKEHQVYLDAITEMGKKG